ncbi:MAG: FAD-binding oxidoreductase [Candidatus Dadabacteria bacterium]|nr:MAG: FAD-binding oxidoreductase [Candidatus Dadabacteria bacterium]
MTEAPAARLDDLAREVPGLEIITEDSAVAERSHDYWMRSLIERRQGRAQRAIAVVRPATTEEVSAVLRWAQRTRTPVVPYGLGSGVCGAILAGPNHVVVDLGRMNELVEVNDSSLVVTVEAGMRGSELESALRARSLTLGHFPQSIELSTVGGWCATRAAGQFSTLYGNIEDMVLGCQVVVPGGTVLDLPAAVRSATGPDLKNLFLGSEGTLGIFTRVTLRVHPVAEASRGISFTLPSFESGVEALRRILRAGWRPAVTRLYDAMEAGRNFQSNSDGEPMLLILSEGPASLVEAEIEAVGEIVESHGGISAGSGPVSSWLEHRNEVPTFESLLDQGLVVDTIEVAIGWDGVSRLYKAVVEETSSLEGVLAMSGHVSHCYTQGANIYFTFIASQQSPEEALERYDRVWDRTMDVTTRLGGTIAHHHGIGRVRKGWLRKELGTAYDVLVRLKKALDPDGIMNPGALVDVD